LVWFFAIILIGTASLAQDHGFNGPYFGVVERGVDGDNFEAKVEIWPTISSTVSVRIRGIDAPELFRPECLQEALGAADALGDMIEILPIGTRVRLENVEAAAFSGSVVANILRQGTDRGRTIVELMMNRGNVVLWTPDQPNIEWCFE
jgi:micrococcal nuclease